MANVSKKIHVVITDFNGWGQTRLCLDALQHGNYRELEIILVDHGTTNETAEGLSALHPTVIRVAASPNLWWTGATNLGIQTAIARGATAIVLLNNDCYVTPHTITHLAAHTTTGAPAIMAPLQRSLSSSKLLTNFATTCFLLGFPTLALP